VLTGKRFWVRLNGSKIEVRVFKHQWIARALSVFYMFAGVVLVAFYAAQLTKLIVRQSQGSMCGADDLLGKRVATIANAADY
jgi:hypothetical protein